MTKKFILSVLALAFVMAVPANAQYIGGKPAPVPEPVEIPEDTLADYFRTDSTLVLTLDDALKIALSENVSVKVADMEVTRTEYAKKGTYAALFPQINGTGSYQRTLVRNDIRAMMGDSDLTKAMSNTKIGSLNSFSLGVSASMPIINAPLWKSIEISGLGVEAAVEKAKASKLDMMTQVKSAYYGVLLAKKSFAVYKEVYENAVANFDKIEKKYKAQKASEMEYLRAKTTVSNAVPNIFNAESSVILALWQLKAVIGLDLDRDIDTEGTLDAYAAELFGEKVDTEIDLTNNTTLRQLDIQLRQLRESVKLTAYGYIPTVSASISLTYSAVANDPVKDLGWFPYSFAGLSLSIPIFSGHKRVYDIRQTKTQAAELELQRDDTERNLRIAAQNYYITMETNMKSFYSAQDAVESAQKSYDIVSKSYELGRATLTDLNDAQLAVVQSQMSQSQAVYSYIVAKSQLEQILGVEVPYTDEEE